ncbi:transcriptional regulator, MarR family [Alicyclobacillus hesperidum URH17-3-68]|uniref:Organic hydroperoxide resistance transcriptional regulator n=1 Tax=Alicyclobacillus hesperidum TaxID=89784 RepID=A0AA37TYZ9_9BACL|nr:MarR family transcriptional regulator [Alicyclobacillus hesperidum]EJY56526.1 transcriptional regulator, MarR family [Alicyclobacillus hesperidum URH17-3-68]GLV13397.1 organic hydroperoxide resistance transcriptional regulator [Alicyclobacillus hesperidum]
MSDKPFVKLDDHLCFTIYACSRETMKLYRPLLEPHGLTFPQYLVLVALFELGECTVKSLGERLYLDSGTLTPLLKRMQESGLVHRRRAEDDERKVYVSLTESGKSLRQRVADVPECVLSRVHNLTISDVERLLTDIRTLLGKIHAATQVDG